MVRVGLIGFGLAGQAFHAPVIRGVRGHGTRLHPRAPHHQREAEVSRSSRGAHARRNALRQDRSTCAWSPLPTIRTTPTQKRASKQAATWSSTNHSRQRWQRPSNWCASPPIAAACVTVYQDRRWDGEFATVKELLKSRTLGAVAEYEARFDRFRLESKPGAWREKPDYPAAGVLWDLGPHLIDRRWCCSARPRRFAPRPSASARPRRSTILSTCIMQYPHLRPHCARASSPTLPALTC